MLLPANCPYAWYRPLPEPGANTIACCRAHNPRRPPDQDGEPPLCRSPGEEAYRFDWRSSFNGHATVRIGRQGEEVALRWVYPWFYGGRGHGVASLTLNDWGSLQEALAVASFWLLDQHNDRRGFDGARWTIEGRRGRSFQVVHRWSPERGGLRELGRTFFNLSGQPLSAVEIY